MADCGSEPVVTWSGLLYRCANVRVDHKLAKLDLYTPIDMRAPGAVWGVYAIECAMDELAVELVIDPVELRLKNYTERDMSEDKPFSSKELRACYRQAAERLFHVATPFALRRLEHVAPLSRRLFDLHHAEHQSHRTELAPR